MKWNFRILELFDAMLYPFEFPDGFRAAAELRGFDFGKGRQPQTPAQKSDREVLAKGAAMYPRRLRIGRPASGWLRAAHPATRAGQNQAGSPGCLI